MKGCAVVGEQSGLMCALSVAKLKGVFGVPDKGTYLASSQSESEHFLHSRPRPMNDSHSWTDPNSFTMCRNIIILKNIHYSFVRLILLHLHRNYMTGL